MKNIRFDWMCTPVGFATTLFFTTLLVYGCFQYIDEPLVSYLNDNGVEAKGAISLILATPILLGLLASLYALIYGLVYPKWAKFKAAKDLFMISIACMVIVSVKNFLKIAFGRTWPNKKPSFFPDDNIAKGLPTDSASITAGFHPFTGLREFASFPSGSTAITVCVMALIGIKFPALRVPALLLGAAVSVLMVLTNIHYLSDVIAGVFIGFVAAIITMKLDKSENS